MSRGPKAKDKIICPRCNRLSQPVRGHCRSCASVLVRTGELKKVQIDDMPKVLTDEQNQILNGLMLGDGCLYRRKPSHTPYLAVLRSQNDREYLVDNYNTFKDFCKRGIIDGDIFDKRTDNTTYYSKFITRRASVFKSHYERWYPSGVKIVPDDLELTPLTMAIWFADDGYIRRTSNANGMRVQLSTESFNDIDTDLLNEKIFDLIGVRFKESGSRLHCYKQNDVCQFIDSINGFLPKSMDRKRIWKNEPNT